MSDLIIELPHGSINAQTPMRYVVSADGVASERTGTSTAALLPKPGRTGTVTLVLPPQTLSWHRVQLPKISLRDRQRVRTVLQGLLEDQLLDDPRHTHIALAPDAAPGQANWVCVCQQQWLESGLAELARAGIAPHRIVPAFSPNTFTTATAQTTAANPATPTLTALGTPEDAWLVISPADADGRVLTLPLSAAARQLDIIAHSPPEHAVQAEPAVYQMAQSALARPAQLLETPRYLLQAAKSPWNLAQLQFANSSADRLAQGVSGSLQALLFAPQWRWVRRGALALLAVQVLGLNVWAWQARAQLQAKRDAVQNIFRTTFTRVPVVVDAPLQMQREVAALQQRSGALTPASFEALTASLGRALPHLPAAAPAAMRYENSALSVQGLALDEPGLARLQELLQADHIEALPTQDDGQDALLLTPAAAKATRP